MMEMEGFAALLAVVLGVSATFVLLFRADLGRRTKRIVVALGLGAGLVALLIWRPVSKTEWRLGVPLSYARAELRMGTIIAKPRPVGAAAERAFVDFVVAMSAVEMAALGAIGLRRRFAGQ